MKLGSLVFLASILFFFGGLFFWGFRSCDRKPMEILTVGRARGLPLGTSGDLHDGFNWDLAQFIGQKLHKKIVFKDLAWSNLTSALCDDEVDILCASLNITNERKKDVAMIHVFGQPYPFLTFLFWDTSHQKELENAKHIRDVVNFFKNRAIGVSIYGTIWEGLLKKYEITRIKQYEHEVDLVSALKQGEVAAIVLGRVSSDFVANQYSNMWALKVALDEPYSYGIGVAINKQRPELVKQIAGAIQDLKNECMIDSWQRKWFGRVY